MSEENKADDPSFAYRMYKKVGPSGAMYADIDGAVNDFGAYFILTTTVAQLVYSQTSGMLAHLRSVTHAATGASASLVTLVNGSSSSAGTNKFASVLASGASVIRVNHMADLRGPVFSKSIYAIGTKGARISITGLLDPNLPSV
jgi:hypothetical protein